jgi:hypothetical protein
MFSRRNPIRWHNRLMDGLTVGLNAGVVFVGLATAFTPLVAGIGLALATLSTLASLAADSRGQTDHSASPRGKALCEYMATRMGLRAPEFAEAKIDNGLGQNSRDKITIDEKFSLDASTPELAAIVGHEIGHSAYGQMSGYGNKFMTFTAGLGLCIIPLATPWIGLAGAALGLGALIATTAASFLLAQIQQRQEEYACDRFAATQTNPYVYIQLLKERKRYGCEDTWSRKIQNRCEPNSLAEQVINLIDTHPPTHRRITAMYTYAARLAPDHADSTEHELLEKFDRLSRHKPAPKPIQRAYGYS